MDYKEVYRSLMDVVQELLISAIAGEKYCGVIPVCYKKLCCSLSTEDVIPSSLCEQDDDGDFSDCDEGDKQTRVDDF
jgi:hypothetical protein